MLDEVIVSRSVLADMIDQFPHNIQLMITREDNFFCFLDVRGAVRHDLFLFGLFVADEFLQDVQEFIFLKYIFPEIGGHISACDIRRIARSAIPSCAVAALVEGQEVCHGTFEPRGHVDIV